MRTVIVAASSLLLVSGLQAQQKASGANAAAASIQSVYNDARTNILKAAEQVPEAKYNFQATKDVRTFGQILGHIVDAQNNICSELTSSPKPYATTTEKTVTTKAGLIAALKASFAACDAAYAAVSDASLSQQAKLFGQPATIAGVLTLNASHDWEHYGNLVTYMRLMGMVPPSSQG